MFMPEPTTKAEAEVEAAVGLIDRGPASKKTCGFPNLIATELGFPPFTTTFLPP